MDGHPVRGRYFREAIREERGFTLIELLVVVVIVGILAAIAIPTYVGQQDKARDTAAQAQLRTAATAQQLFYADNDEYTASLSDLAGFGFRQGEQKVSVQSAGASYCMQAPGGGDNVFKMTEGAGKPEPGEC
ncbi:MAG: hypothetical protein AVDCRST_MAG02-287 [uncultured Rubrobacteraceae bacterium]|uniref:Prepilin-type N-terminal cleavage/methylation domain-containing protein n=1 Tax=uncultured Rubrobacteraceae bacterium TaxID=349277 RepID=A0A6J4QJ54_9ACTN|nr:MAG: hypothetical protein AVDCRST_MAG02-287 [uncultured Rubrobacteraceae bacterium]